MQTNFGSKLIDGKIKDKKKTKKCIKNKNKKIIHQSKVEFE